MFIFGCRRWYYWADRLGMLVWQDFPCISDKHNMAEADREDRQVFRYQNFCQKQCIFPFEHHL